MISPPETIIQDLNVTKLKELISKSGIEHYYILDGEGNSLRNNGDSHLGAHVLTAMFATMLAAAETSFCEMDIGEDVVIKLEAPGSRNFLVFRISEDVILAVEAAKEKAEVEQFRKELLKQTIQHKSLQIT